MIILAFIIGMVVGVILMSLMASKRIDEINMTWYETCLKITDGADIKSLKEVQKHE